MEDGGGEKIYQKLEPMKKPEKETTNQHVLFFEYLNILSNIFRRKTSVEAAVAVREKAKDAVVVAAHLATTMVWY